MRVERKGPCSVNLGVLLTGTSVAQRIVIAEHLGSLDEACERSGKLRWPDLGGTVRETIRQRISSPYQPTSRIQANEDILNALGKKLRHNPKQLERGRAIVRFEWEDCVQESRNADQFTTATGVHCRSS